MKNIKLFRGHASVLAIAVCAAVATGCASNQNAALSHADKIYNDNKSDASLMRSEKAAAHMAAAATALDQAKYNQTLMTSFGEPIDAREVDSLAYVSEQNVLAAKEIAAKEAADAQLAQLKSERDRALLAKNERDARDRQRQAAELAAQQERDRAAAELAASLERAKQRGAEVQQTEDEIKVTFRKVTFDVNKTEIKPEFQATLDDLATALSKRYPNAALEIKGFTDSSGSEQYNAKLSEQRAIAVKTFMIGKGLSQERLASRGLGEANPVASNDTPEGRALNRRVELVVTGVKGQ